MLNFGRLPAYSNYSNRFAPHLLQHHAMPLGKLLSVTLGGIREAGHRALAEEEAEHAADVTSTNLSSHWFNGFNVCRFRLQCVSMLTIAHIPKPGIVKAQLHDFSVQASPYTSYTFVS